MASTEPKNDLHHVRDELKTLLDDLRVRAHLAGMEARDAFEVIRKDAEKISHDAATASRQALDSVIARLRSFSESIGGKD